MNYPTLEQVESADREQICRWWRFLPSPGTRAIGEHNFEEILTIEAAVMDKIAERFKQVGGFNPELSKHIGWQT